MTLRLISDDADVYASHGYGSLMPFCTAIAAILKRKPFVFTVHGYPRLNGMGRVALWIYRNTLARVILGAASRIIVVSRESKKYLVGETDMGKVLYIPNGVDTKAFSCPSFREGEYVSYVGRLDKDKQVGMLINAVSRMKHKERVAARKMLLAKQLRQEEAERWRQTAGKVALKAMPLVGDAAGRAMFNTALRKGKGCIGCGCFVLLLILGGIGFLIYTVLT